jgi:hypothetical protein
MQLLLQQEVLKMHLLQLQLQQHLPQILHLMLVQMLAQIFLSNRTLVQSE